jgi:hypothetical protein
MFALLINGPLRNRQIRVPDQPPPFVKLEEVHPEDRLQVIESEADYQNGQLVTYDYRLIGFDSAPSPIVPGEFHKLALYAYAPEFEQAA